MDKVRDQEKQSKLVKCSQLEELVLTVVDLAKTKAVTAVEVAASEDNGLATTVRLNEVDTVEFNQDMGIGITVYYDKQRGSASTSDLSKPALVAAVEAACDIAKVTGKDECYGLPEKERLAFDYPDIPLYFPHPIEAQQAIELARECEQLALQADKRITNSEGASFARYESHRAYANSQGFVGSYSTTRFNLSCVLVAGNQQQMQRDYDYTTARDFNDLESPNNVATEAVRRTVSRLDAQKISTRKTPVIFSAEVASSLLGSFVSASSGGNLYRKSSFLLDKLGRKIMPDFINIYEMPHLPKGLASVPFDSEGCTTTQQHFVKDGILQQYILGTYSARRLAMKPTGNAGGVHNLCIETGACDLAQLLKKMNTGLLITELMGHGVNILTGDYSRGAAGYWVENGVIQYPVEEITVAGNLSDMFQNIVEIAKDIDPRRSIRTGSILIEEMVVAGN